MLDRNEPAFSLLPRVRGAARISRFSIISITVTPIVADATATVMVTGCGTARRQKSGHGVFIAARTFITGSNLIALLYVIIGNGRSENCAAADSRTMSSRRSS